MDKLQEIKSKTEKVGGYSLIGIEDVDWLIGEVEIKQFNYDTMRMWHTYERQRADQLKVEKQDLTVLVRGLKRDVESLIEQNEQLKHRIPRSIEDDLRRRIERLEQGYKDILSWGQLGSVYSDISAAITFQEIARKVLAGGGK